MLPNSPYLLHRPRRPSAASANWVDTFWTLNGVGGTRPLVALDFVNQRYWDGTSNNAALSTLVTNSPTVDGSGMHINSTVYTATGALLTALQTGAGATVVMELAGGNNSADYGILSPTSGAPDSIMVNVHALSRMDAYNGSSIAGQTAVPIDLTQTGFYVTAWNNSGTVTPASAGHTNASSNNFSAITGVQIGCYNGGSFWPGTIRSMAVYSGKLADKYLRNFTWSSGFSKWNRPFYGNTALQMTGAAGININPYASATLATFFNTANPWSMVTNVYPTTTPTDLQVLFTNVRPDGPQWYGHESYIDNATGKLRVMIFSNWDGFAGASPTTNLIQCDGTTNLNATNGWRNIGVTYDGSGVAAGIKAYIDGSPETLTATHDNITGPTDTIIGNLNIGGQYGNFKVAFMDFMALSSTVRPASYFSNIVATQTRPAMDDFTLAYYDFRDGSGNTLTDAGPNGYHATPSIAGNFTWFT